MVCRICNQDLIIPDDAVVLKQRNGITLMQFRQDKQVHEFTFRNRKTPAPKNPKPEPKMIVLPPKPIMEAPVIEVVEPVEPVLEPEVSTAMAHAFINWRKR